MRDDNRFEELLDQDWGDLWESLPPGPPLVLSQPKSAQLTLRVPGDLVTALRDVAYRKSLPYHALARSWIAEGLRDRRVPNGADEAAALAAPGHVQINIKLAPELLDELKRFSHETRRPYHRLARLWLDEGLRRELEQTVRATDSIRVSLKELMLLLLDTANPRTGQAAVRGITRLQKLLFVIEKRLANDPSRFYAYTFGPFDEQVNDAADALETRGLLEGPSHITAEPPGVEEMMASVLRRRGQREEPQTFALSQEGQAVAARLRRSNAAYEELTSRIRHLREEWDRPDLIERIYEAFPEYTTQSAIKDKVARRAAARRRRSPR
jgi:predicted DNA binding CopG/RHH family protein